jgi:DNA segregation ATPase FtsK/SpoIIIE-like protein
MNDFTLSALAILAPWAYRRYRVKQADDIKIQSMLAKSIRHIAPDANGRLGITYNGQVYRNHDDRAFYGDIGAIVRDVVREELDGAIRLLLASGSSAPSTVKDLLPEAAGVPLPDRVPLRSLIDTASYKDLALGVSDTGPVRADLADLVHVAIGGSSGWGKSVFLRSIGYQLAQSVDPVDLVMVDLEKSTLAPFEACDRLMYPVVDNERDAVAVFAELADELDRRKELFSQHPGIDSLALYNSKAQEPINPLVLLGDEITALLADKAVEKNLRTLALRARKYGMWLILAGQDWKAASLDTAIRNQLSCCIQFKAKSGAQSRILLDRSDAQDIDTKGRALAWLPGREMVEMQAPIIGYQDIIAAMSGGGPRYETPETGDDLEALVIEAWQGMEAPNITKVCREIFDGQNGGANWNRIKAIVYSTGLIK